MEESEEICDSAVIYKTREIAWGDEGLSNRSMVSCMGEWSDGESTNSYKQTVPWTCRMRVKGAVERTEEGVSRKIYGEKNSRLIFFVGSSSGLVGSSRSEVSRRGSSWWIVRLSKQKQSKLSFQLPNSICASSTLPKCGRGNSRNVHR